MGRQGCVLGEDQRRRILQLLASTTLTIPEIAERIGCSRSSIIAINRRFHVRNYRGHRSTWEVTAEYRK
jgi:transposase